MQFVHGAASACARAIAITLLLSGLGAAPGHAAAMSVSGSVRYYAAAGGVPGVDVALSGGTPASGATDATGAYHFAGLAAGDWHLQPAKRAGADGAVTATDAGWALEAAVGRRALDASQQLAADVTGDGRVTALDAARILQLVTGRRAQLPIAARCGSDWAFVPAPSSAPNQRLAMPAGGPPCAAGAIAFSPLSAAASGQDFVAVPFGDVTGNWRASGALAEPTALPSAPPTPTRTRTGTPTPTASRTPTATASPSPMPTRDRRRWPFTRRSPWNHPIGSGARYRAVSGLTSLPLGINYDDRWTAAIALAGSGDPLARVRFTSAWESTSTFAFLSAGGLNCGNSAGVEQQVLANAPATMPSSDGNYYSTRSTTGAWVMPDDYHRAGEDWRATFRLPAGTCPSPDPDGLLAVIQPDGWALDVYAAVVVGGPYVVTTMASWIDTAGDGTGWWSGRRASMLPSFAGLIRTGEISGGRIPHALAALVPQSMLTRAYAWPAYAFDRESSYSGTLPMGALLAIPAAVNVEQLGLSPRGRILARAAQDYGIYLVDRGGSGLTILAELGNPEIRWSKSGSEPADWQDLQIIGSHLQWVENNAADAIGGGGTPRQPLAPPVSVNDP
ncbi:MAG: dockerin type I domain-containing protein [Deltaproteobacteria bacterium]|nr:dockerin type I domain-containing protein [Deltaproteobacteria bacterium]